MQRFLVMSTLKKLSTAHLKKVNFLTYIPLYLELNWLPEQLKVLLIGISFEK